MVVILTRYICQAMRSERSDPFANMVVGKLSLEYFYFDYVLVVRIKADFVDDDDEGGLQADARLCKLCNPPKDP